MKKKIILWAFLCTTLSVTTQNTIDQNGLQSTVIAGVNASATQAKQYEVASVIYNSHHWQNSSIITIELYQIYPRSGYEKYSIEIGYRQGTQATSPKITHLDSQGIEHNAKVSLGTPVDHTTIHSGYVNKVIPIYVDTRYYAQYKVKITHARSRVTTFTQRDQIIINEIPLGVNIADFTGPILQSSVGLWTENGNDIYFDNGNVGIGTNDPGSFKLNVSGNVYHSGKLSIGTSYNGFTANIGGTTYLTTGSVWTTDNFGFANANSTNTGLFPRSDHSISMKTNNLTAVHVKAGGNVGIGTTNPGTWKLAVNGPIRAKEVKVETGWSDFVFEKDYDLPTLEEVENHIKEKGHLKDIPSAEEVAENGILLGQMDSKLLQKIEELTLYTIEQERKIQSLEEMKNQIKELEQQNKQLKSMLEKINSLLEKGKN